MHAQLNATYADLRMKDLWKMKENQGQLVLVCCSNGNVYEVGGTNDVARLKE